MALKPLYISYQSKNNTTGLTDVKAQVYLNGVAKLTGASAVTLSEVDATNSPGLYLLTISAAQLSNMGVATGQVNTVVVYINSATKPGAAPMREEVEVYDTDDLQVILGTPAATTVSADIANLLTAINSIKNNAGFSIPVPDTMLTSASGSNSYVIPVTIYNEANSLIDPDSNTITVGVVNQAGTSRNTYLSSTTMTRTSQGQYTVGVTIPTSAPEEQLIFTFSYSVGGAATARKASCEVVQDVAAAGYALQTTLLATQTTVNSNNAILTNGTYGNAALQSLLTNGTYGLSALQVIEAANQATLNNGTYGLSALLTAINAVGVGGRAV